MSIARQAAQLGNDELGATDPTGLDGLCKLRPISVLSALNFHKFLHQSPIAAVQVLSDSIALRLDAETGFPLADRSRPAGSEALAAGVAKFYLDDARQAQVAVGGTADVPSVALGWLGRRRPKKPRLRQQQQ